MEKETIGIKIWLLVAGLVLWSVVQSCEMKETISNDNAKPVGNYEKNEYNSDFRDFARAVSVALKSDKDFRYMVRDEALKLFDGDYDVLLRHFVNKQVKAQSSLKSEVKDYTVKKLLEDSYMVGGINNKKSSVSIIDELLRKYPDMQIAIPVHAEEWDVNNYCPTVTFLPLEYDEATTETLTGYDAKGNIVSIDAINEPDEPVIVISENERMIMAPDPDDNPVKPSAPTNLIGTQTESGIRLTWTMPAGTYPSNTSGYYIYRKTTDTPVYSLIQNVYGASNRSYDDNNVEASRSYSYYVEAFYQGLTSDPSNYISITAPNYPKPPTSFDAIQQKKGEIELRWDNEHDQYIQETRLSKYIAGVTPGYQLYKSFSPNEHNYIDKEVIPGKTVNYKLNHVTSFGESNAKYDFVKVPYRDISQESPVYIKQIKFTDWKLERWPAGKPEFYIAVSNVDASKKPYTVQDQIDCQFTSKTNLSQIFYGVEVLKWQPGFWYDVLTFTVIEYDKPSSKFTFETSVAYNQKDEEKKGLQSTGSVKYEITFEDHGKKCGNSHLNYFDQPEKWLVFPNYGVQILVSESDN